MRQDELNHTKGEQCLGWLRKNVIKEIPIVGHTLAERSWSALQHDMKHFFSMLVGMAAMMAMPMQMSKHENKEVELLQKFLLMTLYMYAGMFVGGIIFNSTASLIGLCKVAPADSDIQENTINEHAEGLLNDSVRYAA